MGATEERVCMGDVVRIGTVVLQVTDRRSRCFKLARFGGPEFVKEFLLSGRSGYYVGVVEECFRTGNAGKCFRTGKCFRAGAARRRSSAKLAGGCESCFKEVSLPTV